MLTLCNSDSTKQERETRNIITAADADWHGPYVRVYVSDVSPAQHAQTSKLGLPSWISRIGYQQIRCMIQEQSGFEPLSQMCNKIAFPLSRITYLKLVRETYFHT